MVTDDPEAAELREAQQGRAHEEKRLERESLEDAEAAAHRRRAEKARYLREKLAERERSERP